MLHRSRALLASLFVLLVLFLSACGGGGGGGSSSASGGTGAASIFLTDAPHHGFDDILVTIEAIEFLCEGGPVTVFSGMEVVDLTDLEDFSDLFVYAEEVPVGSCQKIRMRVTEIELVKDGESIFVDAPANGKLDLLPKNGFEIREGVTLVIEIDMDANKSIHVVRRGNREEYNFRPVVKVTIRETLSPDKLTRVHGEVTELFDGGFELCSTVFLASRMDYSAGDHPDGGIGDRHRCLDVEIDLATGVFDSNGDPVDPSVLAVGDEATVVGRIHVVDDNHTDMADAGGAGAGHQEHHRSFSRGRGHDGSDSDSEEDSGDSDSDSADSDSDSDPSGPDSDAADSDSDSTGSDSDSADSDTDTGDSDSDSDSDGDGKPRPDLILLAYVVEIGPAGTFLTLDGVVDSEVVGDVFDFRIDPGQGFGDDSVVSTLLQDGTRIFSRSGREIDESEIIPETTGRVDGVLATGPTSSLLKSALVVLDIATEEVDVLRGAVGAVDEALRRLLLLLEDDGVVDEECVVVAEDADIFLIREGETGSTSERAAFEDLYPGLRTDVYGSFRDGEECFVADAVIGFPVECSTNADCEVGLFCAKEEGLCEDRGVCQASPVICTDEFAPVCGCDDVTYGNACEASAAGASIARPGACDGGGPVACGGAGGVVCSGEQVCQIPAGVCDPAAEGVCVDPPEACSDEIEPVCGCDGKTYGNACLAQRAGVAVDSEGVCTDAGVCAGPLGLECGDGELCLVRSRTCDPNAEGRCVQAPAECPDTERPVCGCDDVTYGNACRAAAAGAAIAFAGQCEGRVSCGGMDALSCFDDEVCLKGVGRCGELDSGVCIPTPESCPLVTDPVCGCDGTTYDNGCQALANGVNVESLGACGDDSRRCGGSEGLSCSQGSICVRVDPGSCDPTSVGLCVPAPSECPDTEHPVCGCDGETYRNVCAAAVAGVQVESVGACVVPQP